MNILRGMSGLTMVLCSMALFVPFQLYFNISTGIPGVNVLNLMIIATLVAMFQQPARTFNPPLPLRRNLYAFFFLLTVAAIIGISSGTASLFNDIVYLKTALTYPLLYILFYYGIRDKDSARFVYIAILLVAAVAALQAARQGLDYGLGNYNETRRASGPFSRDWSNANRAGVYFAMFTPAFAVLALMYKGPHKWVRLGAAACTVMGVFATFVTYSRQAYFILALSMMILLLRRGVIWGVIAVIGLSTAEMWMPSSALQRVEMTQTQSEATGEAKLEESAESRLIIWAGAWEMIQDHPLGVGLNRFKGEIGNYSSIKKMDAHNGYILTAAECGIIAFFVLIALMLRLAWLAVPLIRSADNDAKIVGWSQLLASIGILVGNFYGSAFYFGEAMGNYWALSGLAARYRYLTEAAATEVPVPSAEAAPAKPLRRML